MDKLPKLDYEILHPEVPINLIEEINQIAKEEGIVRLAIVGGAVRDEIIYRINKINKSRIKDIDLLIEGSAPILAKKIKAKLGEERVQNVKIYPEFYTAEMRIDDCIIDIASARTERYPNPGENPKVKLAKIESDLARRDFTINSIAIDLFNKNLIDLFKGQDSIINKEISFLHSNSVKDDPTRIIRAARYAAKLNFKLSCNSLNQLKNTLYEWPWEWEHDSKEKSVPPALGTRLKSEIDLLLNQKEWKSGITLLQEWGGLILLDENIQKDSSWQNRIINGLELGLNPLTLLILPSKNSINLAKRLNLSHKQQEIIRDRIEFEKWLDKVTTKKESICWSNAKWCLEIESGKWHPEAIALSISMRKKNWEILLKWLNKWRHIKCPVSAKELINQGWETGPSLGNEMQRLRSILIEKQDNETD